MLLLLPWPCCCLCFTCLSRKASRASQEDGAEEGPCLSEASLGPVPRLPRSAGDRRAAAARVPARSGFGYF
ncbi:hypothetical protein EAT51_16580 [Pseudoxanthomonas winnipegensis]|uniref:Uncharacterized protein n=1 Tax=Pseudoxanthomonas winnipegensis TaxID=2480810 RepID=A0A4Q8LKQ7_9GAMM|nr:hypothetical protein EA662_11335 [Pseudoxanthomonas winnipegensis]TAA31095.1 hypothetical protein EA661_05795 [Pseudoxanthomonas winnipegensis]TAA38594.1 hypothetical protein EAT51_16580 [Pseudoxanthomonas winnipegensis]TBV77628.1 hypothetical protein EYC46_04845 [Pseudoxanthomonas winnipegensis]